MATYNAKTLTIVKGNDTYIIDPLQGNENGYIDIPVTIHVSDWSGTAPYTYVWTDSHLTANSTVNVTLRDGARGGLVGDLKYSKTTGQVTFVTTEPAIGDIPLTVKVIDAITSGVFPIDASIVETDAVVGETTVQGALESLDNGKVDKVTGKGLSTEDYTSAEKTKLGNIESGATANVVSDSLTDTSTTNALSAAKGKKLNDDLTTLNSNIATAFDGKNVRVVAGVIRNDGSGWQFISDSGHNKMNLASISVDSYGCLAISYGFTATKVLSFIVGCDEAYAWAYDVGSSVGLSSATIYVYRKPLHIGGYIYYDGSKWDYSNCKHVKSVSFDTSTGILTITHDNLQTLGYKTNEIFNCNVTGREINAQLGRLGYDTIQVKFINTDGTVNKTLSTNLRVYVSRTATYSLVDADTYVHDSSGNFWIYGVMEV